MEIREKEYVFIKELVDKANKNNHDIISDYFKRLFMSMIQELRVNQIERIVHIEKDILNPFLGLSQEYMVSHNNTRSSKLRELKQQRNILIKARIYLRG